MARKPTKFRGGPNCEVQVMVYHRQDANHILFDFPDFAVGVVRGAEMTVGYSCYAFVGIAYASSTAPEADSAIVSPFVSFFRANFAPECLVKCDTTTVRKCGMVLTDATKLVVAQGMGQEKEASQIANTLLRRLMAVFPYHMALIGAGTRR